MAEIASSVIRRPVTVLAVGALALAGRASGQTSLSIYSDGRVVVRRTLSQALEKGRTALTLKIDGLDPATLFSPDTSVALRSEEHTSELQSRLHLVCRLLLEKKKKTTTTMSNCDV